MHREEQSFNLRFSVEASFPDDYEGDEDQRAWTGEWEARIKPDILKMVFESLRRQPGWAAHIRNRGKSAENEIEVVVEKDFGKPQPFKI
ncbi:MAG: hypothetical protein K2X00_04925 [Nitrospiraceae bacterium]|nr:hypothetical protein [Nitrospiraceae bacterium]OQW66656.1 MAG: hypothetical protein BVN29_05585 [Nitrospira sp. ST-bin5]